jgi:hypothetical protein
MTSSEGEGFAFRSMVPVEGAVEVWMTGVEAEMRRTLAVVMKEGKRRSCSVEAQLPEDAFLLVAATAAGLRSSHRLQCGGC